MRWNELKRGYADQIAALAKLPAHEVLGVDSTSSREEIKAAYVRLIKTYHPDRSDPFMARHNQEVSKLVNIAYRKLKEHT